MPVARKRSANLVGLVGAIMVAAGWALAVEPPAVPAPVARLLEGQSLTEEERKDIRIRHGVWEDGDLDTPVRKAQAAVLVGRWDDPALADAGADVLDRVEGMVNRGEVASALAATEDVAAAKSPAPRAVRLRCQALLLAGKGAEAEALLRPLSERLASEKLDSAEELVEGVRCMMLRADLPASITGATAKAGDYRAMLAMLARARTELDRLCWRAFAVEALLLVDKDNGEEGEKAAREAIELCPRSAEAKFALGSLAVDTFAFDEAENLAGQITEDAPASPYAATLIARAKLRQSDSDGATLTIAPSLARFPNSPLLKAVEAATAAIAFDVPRTTALLKAFEESFPGSAAAEFEVGRMLSDARQYAEAASHLSAAAKRAPGWARPLSELGLLEMQAGRDAESLKALEAAFELDPFNVRADNTLRLVREMATYDRVESEHFIVRFKPGVDGIVAREMLEPLEANHARVSGKADGGIDFAMTGKTMIELMPDHRWFAVRIAGMPRIHTIAAATGPVVAMEAPRSGPNHLVGPYDWVRVVRHEYTHTVTLARTKNRLPHWYTEAAAVNLEDAPRDYSACKLLRAAVENDALFDFEQINLAFVRPKKATDRGQAYAQGQWMYAYIIERWGSKATLDLLDKYGAGVKEPEAVKSVLGIDREQFLKDFTQWGKGELVKWGMGGPSVTPPLKDILREENGDKAPGKISVQLADACLAKHPEHTDLLELAIATRLEASKQQPTQEMLPLLTRYATARPVDPLPHKLLATWYLSGGGSSQPDALTLAAEHLEYLDAREQYTAAFAMELANRYGVAGDWDKAWAKALRAVRIAPYDPATRELAAVVSIKRKDFDAAKWQLEALVLLEPDREIHKKRLDSLAKLKAEAQ